MGRSYKQILLPESHIVVWFISRVRELHTWVQLNSVHCFCQIPTVTNIHIGSTNYIEINVLGAVREGSSNMIVPGGLIQSKKIGT